MNNLSNHFLKESERFRLTKAEKDAMRLRVFEALATPVPSPYQRFFAPRAFAYAFMSILVIGSGTAYAAQGSLPGTLLYPVMVHMNEKMEVALATTPAQKLEVSAKLAERRIQEVTILAAQGTLDDDITAELEENFDVHSKAVEDIAGNPAHTESVAAFADKVDASLAILGRSNHQEGENTPSVAMMSARTAFVATSSEKADVSEKTSAKKGGDAVQRNSERFREHVRSKIEAIRAEKPNTLIDIRNDKKE